MKTDPDHGPMDNQEAVLLRENYKLTESILSEKQGSISYKNHMNAHPKVIHIQSDVIKQETYWDKTDGKGELRGRLERIRELMECGTEPPPMTAQPSQETVKPEPTQEALNQSIAHLYLKVPTSLEYPAFYRILNSELSVLTQRIEAAATQKLEAEKAEGERELLRVGCSTPKAAADSILRLMGELNERDKPIGFATWSEYHEHIIAIRKEAGALRSLEAAGNAMWHAERLSRDEFDSKSIDRIERAMDQWKALVMVTTQPQPAAGTEGKQS